MNNVYVLQEMDQGDCRVVGVFEAERLAEDARKQAEDRRRNDDESSDWGVFYRITAFQTGKLYLQGVNHDH
jgi:hypothetical protein